jgi:hypothetical protein
LFASTLAHGTTTSFLLTLAIARLLFLATTTLTHLYYYWSGSCYNCVFELIDIIWWISYISIYDVIVIVISEKHCHMAFCFYVYVCINIYSKMYRNIFRTLRLCTPFLPLLILPHTLQPSHAFFWSSPSPNLLDNRVFIDS